MGEHLVLHMRPHRAERLMRTSPDIAMVRLTNTLGLNGAVRISLFCQLLGMTPRLVKAAISDVVPTTETGSSTKPPSESIHRRDLVLDTYFSARTHHKND